MNLYKLISKRSEYNYDKKLTNKCLILIRKSTTISSKEREELFIELFMNCSAITIKAVNNFKFLVKEIPSSKVIHSSEDITNECYIVMHRCVMNMKWSDISKFHFYLNSALNRAMFRIFERQYKKHLLLRDNDEVTEIKISRIGIQSHVDMIEFDMTKLEFSEQEMKLITMKVEGHNFQEFLKENKMSHVTYKHKMEIIKQKLLKIYKGDDN